MFQDLHPLLVHFPIVLLPLALLWSLRDRWSSGSDGAAANSTVPVHPAPSLGAVEGLLAAACVSAIAAAATGNSALAGYALEGRALETAGVHSRLGGWVAWLAGLALLLRILLLLELRPGGGLGRRPAGRDPGDRGPRRARVAALLRWGAMLLALLATVVVWAAGFQGGRLVHEEGVTRATAPRAQPEVRPDAYRAD